MTNAFDVIGDVSSGPGGYFASSSRTTSGADFPSDSQVATLARARSISKRGPVSTSSLFHAQQVNRHQREA